jgi:hypothetical protein
MSKDEKKSVVSAVPAPPAESMPATGCVVCGSYAGTFVEVTKDARAHESCSASRPDVVAKVKARA